MKKSKKRIISFFLTIALMLTIAPPVFAASDHVYVRQVYGGGGKEETPILNSFIELYNPTDKEIDLSSYVIDYNGTTRISLTGTIPANGSYLITGAKETTTDELLTLDLPSADQTTDLVISNKNYTIQLKQVDAVLDTITAGDSDATTVSKQKSLLKNADDTYSIIGWQKSSVQVDEAYVASYSPKNSKGEIGKVHGSTSTDPEAPTDPQDPVVPEEPTYTPVETSDVRVKGFYDENASLKLELAGRYNSGAKNDDGGSLEIVQYNPVNGFAYAVSGVKGKVIAVDLNGKLDGDQVVSLNGTEYDIKTLVNGFSYGDITSVSISKDGTKLAAAIQAEDYAANGIVAIFKCNSKGSLELLTTQGVGVQPDMVKFVGNDTILTADEGEPRNGENGVDPMGSVSIVKLSGNDTTVKTVYFDKYDARREELTAAGVLIQKGKVPSEDFEPEYIAVAGNTAYVSLQEANAIAMLDLNTQDFTGVYSIGFRDYGQINIDLEKNDAIEFKNYEGVFGIRMPDGIDAVEIGGKTYVLTANEGDSRADWAGYNNEYENKTSPNGKVTLGSKVVWFNSNMWDGLDSEQSYIFGGRSFSIYEVTSNGLNLVYDSGSTMEEVTAETIPDYFNTSNDKISLDNRSGKKGPEPETVIAGTVNGKTYAFVALERIGGIMVYDITDPANTSFVNYINSRDFATVIQGDVSPEGLCFISENNSKNGTPMLISACEVSGTLGAYNLSYDNAQPEKPETGDPEPENPETNPVVYHVMEGADATFTISKDGKVTIKIDGEKDKFVNVEVDGTVVDSKYYTVEKGSTIITFSEEYLKTLSVGKHSVKVNYTDGSVTTTLTVKNPEKASGVNAVKNTPKTGDSGNVTLWVLMALVAATVMISYIPKMRKK